jgi:hypothetical protein
LSSAPQVEREHIRDWIDERGATILPVSESARFAAFLEGLPWLGVGMPDWRSIGAVELHLDRDDLEQEIASTPFGRCEHAFFMFGPAEPGIVAPSREVIEDVDLLSWKAPGPKFFCGVRAGEEWTVLVEAFGAYDGADHLYLRM